MFVLYINDFSLSTDLAVFGNLKGFPKQKKYINGTLCLFHYTTTAAIILVCIASQDNELPKGNFS